MIQQAEEEEEEEDDEEEEEQEEEEHVGSPEGKSASEVGKVHLHNKEFFTPGMLYRKIAVFCVFFNLMEIFKSSLVIEAL